MAEYGTIDIVANPLTKATTNTLDILRGHPKFWVLYFPSGSAVKPIVWGTYTSIRKSSKRVAFLLGTLVLAYTVFLGATGQWFWVKEGQLPPP
jgi:hypothetical protein